MSYANYKEALEMLPEHMRDGMRYYIERGVLPGDFLTSVLLNDLKGAYGNADQINERRVRDYVQYLYNYAPSQCWGSVENVREWIKMHAESREQGVPNE
jgi:hypothetical protein